MTEKPALHPDMPVDSALRAAARHILDEARAALEQKDNAVAVHDYRKAMKRWRALLRLLEPFVGDARGLRAEARELARELSGARDAQAAIEALEDLTDAGAALSPRLTASIRGRLEEIRRGAEAETLTQAKRAQQIVALDRMVAAVEQWQLDQVTFSEIARELSGGYRRMRKDAPQDWRTADPEALHEMRSRAVVHRYQMELVIPLWPKFMRLWVKEAQSLRERLGSFQDLVVLQDFTRPHAPLARYRSRLVPLINDRQAKHRKRAKRIAGRLLAEQPKAFRRRLEALWDERRR